MKRIHLFEFEDQPWLPEALRNAATAYLRAAYQSIGVPSLWAKEIAAVMQTTGSRRILDLGSGSSGPVLAVLEELRKSGMAATVTLTDLYPRDLTPTTRDVTYWPAPVDARAIPEGLQGVRTMFASFHHFRATDAQSILADAARAQAPICVFEATSRSLLAVLSSLLIPVLVLLLTPRIKPLTWTQLVFTYLLPVLPVLIFWDGLVSHLRTYSGPEMLDLASRHAADGYQWRAGSVPVKGIPEGLPFLIGMPSGRRLP